MHAYVYKSRAKADTYVYLAERDDFGRLPEAVRTQLDPLQFVLDIALTPGRRLAQVDAAAVRENLGRCGFYLQLPQTAALMQESAADADISKRRAINEVL